MKRDIYKLLLEKYQIINKNAADRVDDILKLDKTNLKEAPAPAPAPVKTPATPITVPGTPSTKPGRTHPLTPTQPGISPRPKAEGADDIQKFITKRSRYKK